VSGRHRVALLALALVGVATPSPGLPPAADVERGIESYWAGQYRETIALLAPLCAAETGEDVAIECFKYLAFSHVALGESDMAQQAFSRLLAQDAEYQLDESLVSPKILEQFHVSRQQLASELFEKGKAAYFEKNYETATDLLARVLRLDPEQVLAKEYSQLASEQVALVEKEALLTKAASAPPPAIEEPEDRVYHVTSRMLPPTVLFKVQPDYPSAERRAGRQGTVILTAIVGKDGVVREPKVIRSVSPALDAAAVQAVLQWRYRAARLENREVAVYTVVRLSFNLNP
jgi:TonB family protein